MVSPTLMPSLATSMGLRAPTSTRITFLASGFCDSSSGHLKSWVSQPQRRLDDGIEIAFGGVDQRRMAFEITEGTAATPFDFEAAVVGDGFHRETDFVHMGDDEDAWCFAPAADGVPRCRIKFPAASVSVLAHSGNRRWTVSKTGVSCSLTP